MFLRITLHFWFDEPLIFFLADYMAAMWCFAWISHYFSMKLNYMAKSKSILNWYRIILLCCLQLLQEFLCCFWKDLIFFHRTLMRTSSFGWSSLKHKLLFPEIFTSLSKHIAYPSPSSTILRAVKKQAVRGCNILILLFHKLFDIHFYLKYIFVVCNQTIFSHFSQFFWQSAAVKVQIVC